MKDVKNNSFLPVYPCLNYRYEELGLNKREYYAGLAFHALLSNPEWSKYIADLADGDINARNALRRKYADYL